MVSELFFYFTDEIVRTDFERNPLTHTVTHITIGHGGQGSTKGLFLVDRSAKNEKPSGNSL